MTSILLLHADGQDLEALSAFLSRAGNHVSTFNELGELVARVKGGALEPALPVVVLQEQILPEPVDLDFLAGFPVLVLGRRRRLVTTAVLSRLDDPYFLNAVLREVEGLGAGFMGARGDASSQPGPTVAPGSGVDQGLLLRGIAHALNNPLSAASGWLQLLSVDLGDGDSRSRALNQVRGEMHRMERLLQALGLIGGRPSNLRAELDLDVLVEDRVQLLEKEGLPVSLETTASVPRIPGDPGEFGLMLDLLIGSFLEERGRVRQLDIKIARQGAAVVLSLEEEGGTLPGGCDPSDLGLLLRRCRHSRAIGIALAAHLVVDRLGGEVRLEGSEGGRGLLSMSIPVVREKEAGA